VRYVTCVECVVAAIGCADFATPTGTVVDRQGDTAVVRCTGVTDAGQLTTRCVNGTWTPTPPTAGCSATTSASTAAVKSFDFGAFALSQQGSHWHSQLFTHKTDFPPRRLKKELKIYVKHVLIHANDGTSKHVACANNLGTALLVNYTPLHCRYIKILKNYYLSKAGKKANDLFTPLKCYPADLAPLVCRLVCYRAYATERDWL